MDSKAAADLYQRSAIENAPPIQVTRMLYQGLLRFLNQAENAGTDSVEYDANLQQADAILTELRNSLNHEVAPEFAENLDSLYAFCEVQLAQAALQKDAPAIGNAREVLTRLLDGWNRVDLAAESAGGTECAEPPSSNG